jgi:hypothetical protein
MDYITTGEAVKENIVRHVPTNEDKILSALGKIYAYEPRTDAESQRVFDTKNKLVREWFALKMRENYQELSQNIFTLQRGIDIDLSKYNIYNKNHNSGEKYVTGIHRITIPLFCVSANRVWRDRRTIKHDNHEYEITLSSERYAMPPEVKKAHKEAQLYAYRVFFDALKTEPVGYVLQDSMLRGVESEYWSHPGPDKAQQVTMWQPRVSDLKIDVKEIPKVVDRDPLLVLQWGGRSYLVTAWDEPDELPFDDILADALKPNEQDQTTLDDLIAGGS